MQSECVVILPQLECMGKRRMWSNKGLIESLISFPFDSHLSNNWLLFILFIHFLYEANVSPIMNGYVGKVA